MGPRDNTPLELDERLTNRLKDPDDFVGIALEGRTCQGRIQVREGPFHIPGDVLVDPSDFGEPSHDLGALQDEPSRNQQIGVCGPDPLSLPVTEVVDATQSGANLGRMLEGA